MANQMKTWMPLVLIGGVLWFMSRDGILARPPGPVPPPGEDPYRDRPIGGAATVRGNLGPLNVQGLQRGPRLRTHRLARVAGDRVNVIVTWTNLTANFKDEAIRWPARILVELGHSTGVLGSGGWDNMAELLENNAHGHASWTNLSARTGTHSSSLSVTIGDEPNPPQDWDVRVRLEMQGSTAAGSPDGIWAEMARETHEAGVRTIAPLAPSSPLGQIAGVRVIAASEIIHNFQGGDMQQLGMRAQRPPWGMVGHPDVRQWPVSNRNTLLPGVGIMVRQGRVSAGSPIGPGRRMYAI